jgi:hypothetical protein
MLFNKDYLFIHVPRTAGKCIKSSILNHLESPRYLCQKHINSKFFNKNNYNHYSKENTHLSLNELVEKNFIWPEKINFNTIKIILCARDPLDRVKSLFKYHEYINRKYGVVLKYNFESFILEKLGTKPMSRNTYEYCNINGEIPKNLHFIRYSHLNQDLSNLLGVEINTEKKRHNAIYKLNDIEQKEFYRIKYKNQVVDRINQWESWGIENKLFEPVTKDMIL